MKLEPAVRIIVPMINDDGIDIKFFKCDYWISEDGEFRECRESGTIFYVYDSPRMRQFFSRCGRHHKYVHSSISGRELSLEEYSSEILVALVMSE